jgi:hypothetical protein
MDDTGTATRRTNRAQRRTKKPRKSTKGKRQVHAAIAIGFGADMNYAMISHARKNSRRAKSIKRNKGDR